MGEDTKILLTEETDVLRVLRFASDTFDRSCALVPSAGSDCYWLNMKDGDDQRQLFICPPGVCSGDYADVHIGPAILMSLGCWGNSEVIARKFVAHFGGLFMPSDSVGDWKSMPKTKTPAT